MQSLVRATGHMRRLRQSTGRCSGNLFAAARRRRGSWSPRGEFEEYQPSIEDEEFEISRPLIEKETWRFREHQPRYREYQSREARTGPRRGNSPAEVTAPQLRYLFKVPKYVPMEGKYSVLKVVALPDSSSSSSSSSERWEAEGEGTNRHVEVVAGSTSRLLNPFAADPDPVEVTVEVTCTWGDTNSTPLALVMDTFSLKGAVALLKVSATEGTDVLKRNLQELLDKGLHTKRAWRGRVLALAEAVDTSADSKALACMSEQLEKVRSPPQPFVSMPVGRVHVPADTSIAALGRLALASYLPIEEAHAQLAPPQSLRERLEEIERERLEEGGSGA